MELALVYYVMTKECSSYFKKFEHLITRMFIRHCKTGDIQGLVMIIESFIDSYVMQYHIQQFTSYLLVIIKYYTIIIYKIFRY